MALIKSSLASGSGALKSNTCVKFDNTGVKTLETYTDGGSSIIVPSKTNVSGVIAGIDGKTSVETTDPVFYGLIKKDGTIVNGVTTANVSINVTGSSEIILYDISASSTPQFFVTIT